MKQYIDAKPGWLPRSLSLLVVVLVAATLAISLGCNESGEMFR